jgi:hypothetical protein
MIIAMGAARRQTPTRALEATHLSSAAFWLLRSGLDQHANGSPVAVLVCHQVDCRACREKRPICYQVLSSEPGSGVGTGGFRGVPGGIVVRPGPLRKIRNLPQMEFLADFADGDAILG